MKGSNYSALFLSSHKSANRCRKVANSLLEDLTGLAYSSVFSPVGGGEEMRYRKEWVSSCLPSLLNSSTLTLCITYSSMIGPASSA